MIKKRYIKIICFFFAIITFFSGMSISMARADDIPYPFDYSNVLDDLEGSEGFELMNYPWDVNGIAHDTSVINFVEWCYSPFKKGDFALYVYLYNPRNLKIDVNAPSNRIQIATAYNNADGTPATIISGDTVPSDYDTFKIEYCNKSERAGYEGLFYKFRVIDQIGGDGLTIEERVYSGERRYDVSGFTFVLSDGTAKEITVGGTYFFKGYAAGYGADEYAQSTLKNTKFQSLETIRLTPTLTTYRFDEYEGYMDDFVFKNLTSVYFSVPNKYMTDKNGNLSGTLEEVHLEWYEYCPLPIIVSYDDSIIAKYGNSPALPYYVQSIYANTFVPKGQTQLVYKIKESDISKKSLVRGSQILEDLINYDISAVRGYLPIGNGQISADLFSGGHYDSNRTLGYNQIRIKANDSFRVWLEQASAWDKFWGVSNLQPLYVNEALHKITEDEIKKANDDFANALYVSELDSGDIKSKASSAINSLDETPYLLRFAVTNQYVEDIDVAVNSLVDKRVGYKIKETAFFDLKFIDLTFKVNGEYKVFAAVQDPANHIPDIGGVPQPNPWWWVWAILVGTIVLTVLVIVYGKKILKAVKKNGVALTISIIAVGVALFLILYTGITTIILLGGF